MYLGPDLIYINYIISRLGLPACLWSLLYSLLILCICYLKQVSHTVYLALCIYALTALYYVAYVRTYGVRYCFILPIHRVLAVHWPLRVCRVLGVSPDNRCLLKCLDRAGKGVPELTTQARLGRGGTSILRRPCQRALHADTAI